MMSNDDGQGQAIDHPMFDQTLLLQSKGKTLDKEDGRRSPYSVPVSLEE